MPRETDDFFVPDLTEGAEAGLYLSLFELMNEGLIIASDETILEVNSAVCRLLERDYRDLAGQPLSTLFPTERAFLKTRGALFIQGEMRGSLRVGLPGGRERDLSYVAAARIRPGVHALILSPDPVTGLTPGGQRATDTVWPRLAAALDQPALVIDARGKIMAANAPARRRFATGGGALTGLDLSALCALSGPAHEAGPVTVTPADGSAPIHGRLLAGPEPGWQLLLLSTAPRAPAPPAATAAAQPATDLNLFGANPRAVIVTDASHRILSVNAAFTSLTGLDAAQIVGQPLAAAASGRQDGAFFARLERSLSDSDAWQGEFWLRNRKGEAFPEWLCFNRVADPDGRTRAHIGLFSDLSARRQAESRADYLANHDALTGLPRAHFIEARFNELAPSTQRRQQHLALAYLDIDQFKQINLAHGHAVGDQILQQLAGRLRQCSPRIQIARPGSDRFLALIHGVELLSEVTREANVLHEAVSAPFKAGETSVTLSASLGAAVFPGDGAGFSELCALAATALERARLEGPGAIWFHTHELNTASFEQAALERALTHAVSRDELEMHFQPVVDADTGAIIAAEALLRWRHPDMGLVPAHQFLPVAQGAGLDLEIGQHALRMVCAHAAEWHGAGLSLPVAIGATEHMLTYGRLPEILAEALRDSGLPATAIELNLPEACLLRDHDQLLKSLYALDSMGVRIAITAVGATPLPLGPLRQRPVHRLKLDRSLIREPSHVDNQCVLAATVAAANALGLSLQGVGVETDEQQAALQSLGVVRQQGRLFAAPMPADDFAQLL